MSNELIPSDLSNDEKLQKYALFLTLSKEEKMLEFGFHKQKEFGEMYGLTEKTLSIWKNHNERLKRYRKEVMLASRLDDRLPRILDRMVERAEVDGDVNAAKELFKIAGMSTEKVEIIYDQRIKDILADIVEILKEEVKDPQTLNRIANRFRNEINVN